MSSTRIATRAVAALAAAFGMIVGLATPSVASPSKTTTTDGQSYNGLALTPPMGWNDWSYYQCNIDENLILQQGRALVSSGLAAKGYDTVTTDDCWMARSRAADGTLQADPAKFPHGMAWLGAQLHTLGLKFGIYEDEGTSTCGGYPGTWGHEVQDADTFASWGVDYVKLDGCNVPSVAGQTRAQTYEQAYTKFSNALLDTGRDIVFSDSMPAYFQGTGDWYDTIDTATHISNLWREGTDVVLGQGANKWSSILHNYSYNVPLERFAGPGHWNDPDFLIAGDSGLTTDEMQSQMTLWAEMAAPLISSTDLTELSPAALAILGNRDIIAVDQDQLGVQGSIVASGSDYDVLAKPLAGGDVSVVLFNKADTAQTIQTTTDATGVPSAHDYELTDLVSKQQTETAGVIAASVPPHGTVMYRVHPGGAKVAPAVAVHLNQPSFSAGQPSTVTAVVTDNGTAGVDSGSVDLSVPDGWSVQPSSVAFMRIPTAGSATVRFQVVAAAPPPGRSVHTLIATTHYRSRGIDATATGRVDVVTDTPYQHLADAFNNVAITDESDPTPGNFDGGGNSYSAQALAAAGATPGATIDHDGVAFTWPDVPAGKPDNVTASGQEFTMSGSGELAVLGSASGLNQIATVTVTYTDGSTSQAQLGLPNWCCDNPHHYGTTPVLVTDHRDTQNGPANFGINYDVFYNTVPLDEGKTVAKVTLPNAPALHIFAMAVKPLVAAPPTSDVYASDLEWRQTTNGWGPVERDHSLGENQWGDGNAITLHGVVYPKGLGTAPFAGTPGTVDYDLGGNCTSLTATIGLDDEEPSRGSVGFAVIADGATVFSSGVFKPGTAPQTIDVPLSGAQHVELQTNDGGDGDGNDHGDWANAQFHCGG